MKWLNDLFGTRSLEYPTPTAGVSEDKSPNVVAKWFAPRVLDYPLPTAPTRPGLSLVPPSKLPVSSDGREVATVLMLTPNGDAVPITFVTDPRIAPAVVAQAPTAQVAPSSLPVVQSSAPVAQSSAPVAQSGAQSAAQSPPASVASPAATTIAQPLIVAQASGGSGPRDVILRAWSFNPDFDGPGISRFCDENGDIAESVEDDDLLELLEWVSIDSDAVCFRVPDGCNAVEILTGPIEVVPNVGTDSDLDFPIATGQVRVLANGCACAVDNLRPGDTLQIVVPWRGSGAVSLPAGRLRQLVHARFYAQSAIN
jgi:hypothetical protein